MWWGGGWPPVTGGEHIGAQGVHTTWHVRWFKDVLDVSLLCSFSSVCIQHACDNIGLQKLACRTGRTSNGRKQ